MAITLLSHTAKASVAGANVTTSGISCTGASLIVVAIGYLSGGGRTVSLSDSSVNTWILLSEYNDGSLSCKTYYCANPSVSGSQTFSTTNGGTTNFASIAVAAFAGTASSNVLDVKNGKWNSVAASSFQPGSITPTLDNELVITAIEANTSTDFPMTVNGSFSITDQVAAAGGQTVGVALAYLIQTSAAAANPTWTLASGSDGADLMIASFFALPVLQVNPTSPSVRIVGP